MSKHYVIACLLAVCSLLLAGCAMFQGEDGKDGAPGEVGLQGPQGPQGFSLSQSMDYCFDCVQTQHIEDGAIDGRVLGPDTICSAEIAGFAVTSDHIAPNAITGSKLDSAESPPPVGTDQIRDFSIGGTQLSGCTIGNPAAAINADHIAPLAANYEALASDSVDTANVSKGALHHVWTKVGNETIDVVATNSCQAWTNISDMSVPIKAPLADAAYLIFFNATIWPLDIDARKDEKALIRIALQDGDTYEELTRQSFSNGIDSTGVGVHSTPFAIHKVVQLDPAVPVTVRVQWTFCGGPDGVRLIQNIGEGNRRLTVIEMDRTIFP